MIRATKISEDFKINFEWDEVKFNLKYLSPAEIKTFGAVRDKGVKKRKDEFDVSQFSKKYVRKAVRGWENFKYKDLPEICPGFLFEEDPETEVEFSEDNLNFIAENSGVEFQEFLITANSEIPKILNQKKEEEIKNL